MGRKAILFTTAAFATLVCGCASTQRPNWCNPGSARQQQIAAEQYDPYPENDVGAPVVGGRPREYQIPPAETLRARWPLVKKP